MHHSQGSMKFQTQISPLLNFIQVIGHEKDSRVYDFTTSQRVFEFPSFIFLIIFFFMLLYVCNGWIMGRTSSALILPPVFLCYVFRWPLFFYLHQQFTVFTSHVLHPVNVQARVNAIQYILVNLSIWLFSALPFGLMVNCSALQFFFRPSVFGLTYQLTLFF